MEDRMLPTTLTLSLPTWVRDLPPPDPLAHLTDRMELVLDLAMRNVERNTGGPFAAAVFEQESGRLVSVGVNRVVPENCSVAHAEVLAIALAQASTGTYDLGGPGQPRLQLVSSSQMCAMCLGAVVWSGVGEVVYSTTSGDVIATVGFDEGPMPPDYSHQLSHRGISVVAGVMRDEGLAVLRRYVASGGVVYNAHH
jgi:tRNA(Arg) A34 adenosine deaminase TadA